MSIKIESNSSGRFKFEAISSEGVVRNLGEFDNLITDIGLTRMGANSDYLAYCRVGSGSTTPQFTDTSLVSQVAGVGGAVSTEGVAPVPPYHAWSQRVFTFAAGVAAGNLSEVGVGWAASGTTLFSRALILDASNNPTTITIQPDETLRVTYVHKYFPNIVDSTGTVTLTGNLAGTYSYVARPANVTSSSNWVSSRSQTSSTTSGSNYFYSGDIGGITSQPSGTPSAVTYSSNISDPLTAEFTLTAGVDAANFVGGVKSYLIRAGNGTYQVGFTPAIPKLSDEELQLKFKFSWGRK